MGHVRPATVIDTVRGDSMQLVRSVDLHVCLTPFDKPALVSHREGELVAYVRDVPYDEAKQPGTWHWPPRL